MFKLFFKHNHVLRIVKRKHFILRFFILLISCFIYALTFNLFLVPNNIVVGGMSGLAIIIKEITGLSTSIFIYASTIILTIISYIFLGKEKTLNNIVGSIVFTIMISITESIAKNINISFESTLIMLIVVSFSYGVSSGLIYRSGFNTGGSDIIATLVVKYAKMSVGRATAIVNAIIIGTGALVFGFTNAVYAVIILLINTKIVDIVMMGVNDSKMCFIKSKKWDILEKHLNYKLKLGVTEMGSKGGLFKKKDPILMVIVPFHTYYDLKEQILKEDPKAFISSIDCYTVLGGYKKNILPF